MTKIRLLKLHLLLITGLLTMVSCEEDITEFYEELGTEAVEKINVSSYQFSPDCKYLYVNIKQVDDVGSYVLNDTNHVKINVSLGHSIISNEIYNKRCRLKSVNEMGEREIDSLKMSMLVLVDLTLPQEVIDKEYYAVRKIRNLFSPKNLFLAFITHEGVSESMPATDYVLDNNFKQITDSIKYLYRAILEKCNEVTNGSNQFAQFNYHAILVFSDGVVYQNEDPIDPDHFTIQEQLIQKSNELGKDSCNNLFYANFSERDLDEETVSNADLLKLICKNSHGSYEEYFNWPHLKQDILGNFNIDIADFMLTLVNADRTVFKGDINTLKLRFLDAKTDSLITEAHTKVHAGSIYRPITVNGARTSVILLQGIVWVLIILALVYICLQYIVPYIRYRIFRKKYVLQYTGNMMMFNNHPVDEKCYYCKSPFQEGDEIVVKCEHVMHKDCWDENGYHCPEHGRHCKEGSHYYNQENLADPKNSTFYLKWTIMSIIAGTVAWMVFTSIGRFFGSYIIEFFFQFFYNLTPEDKGYEDKLTTFCSNFEQLPSFGLWISFFTTFFLSLLSVFRRKPLNYIGECLLRAFIAGIGGWLSFAFVGIISFVMGLADKSFLLTWMPWPLTGCVIALCVTWHTRIRFRMWWILAALALGLVSMSLWDIFFVSSFVDYRGILLISHVVFSLGLGLCIAKKAPRSERFFLHIDGAIKAMDVALYKWLRNNPDGHVAIGKSVDCQLQLSWDINSSIPPVQAEIYAVGGRLCLIPVEDGVFSDDKALSPGERLTLYHGTRFKIGNTSFTYLEKDI